MTSNRMTRRGFLRGTGGIVIGTAVGSSLLAACGDDDAVSSSSETTAGGGSEPVELASQTLQLNWVKNVEFGGFWVAVDEGFYEEEGIDLKILGGGPNIGNVEQLTAGGATDIGMSTHFFGFVDAIAAGAEITLIGAQYQISPTAILSLAGSPILTAEDLVGKRVGGPQGRQRELDAILKLNGLPLDYEFVPIGFDVEALVEGQVDGMSAFITNQALILEDEGVDSEAVTFADLGLATYSNMVFVSNSYLEENRDLVVKFMRATVKGWEVNEEDPARAARLSVNEFGVDLGLDLDQQIKENELQIELMKSDLTAEKGLFAVSPEDVENDVYPAFREAGFEDLPDVSSYIDTSILEDVFEGSARLTGG